MVSCEYCGESIDALAFKCDYCSHSFCQSHRLPERHDCSQIVYARPPASSRKDADAFIDWSRGARSVEDIDLQQLRERAKKEDKPYSVVEVEQTVGSTPEPDFDSSPDVAIDGSIAGKTNSTDSDVKNGEQSSGRTPVLLIMVGLLFLLLGLIFWL